MPKIALIQLSADARPSVNKEKTEAAIREAAAHGAQIICTQELFTTEYFCRTEECDLFNLAEPIPGELTEAHCKLAAELGVVIVASGFEKRATGLYHNTAWVVDADGTFLGMYRKMHIPQDPGFEEKFYFTPGDLGYKAFETKFGRISVLICTARGKPCSAATPWRTGATSAPSTAWGRKGKANSGGSPSWRTTTAKSSPRPPSAMKPSCTRSWTWTRWKTTAASGPSSATAA